MSHYNFNQSILMDELLPYEKLALEKREEFLDRLSDAQSFDDVRDAVSWFAVENGEDSSVVVNFIEGAYRDDNMTDGATDVSVVMVALDELEEGGAVSVEEVQAKMPIYAVEDAVCRLLGIASDDLDEFGDEPVDSTI